MKRADTWKPLSEVLGRLAGKLAAQMDKRGGHVGAHTLDNVTASRPGQGGTRHPKGRTGDLSKVGLARPNHQREAGADVFGQSMHASEGNSGAHDLPPLFDSRSSTMTKPRADKRVRNSQ